ncbi:hypothetical protein CN425_27200 [Bacillus cereus]|uniref:Uncharacterized protein n=1 Tax=Bacillus cereus TaxID=1396 RepID=A0A2A8PNB3_BACCE|nr:hypothetical protein [Bacillus cereus]EJS62872.1 hypothetical protein ICU_04850 [Bacillus cereus BAG2X1-1]PEA06117.1 hypothetical protein CON38_27085 [Bacillus cereus]PEV94770.1 hypothetical protein CN425_27200 [Bacillus cereus]
MYTAFRGKVIIKDEYKGLVELTNTGSWEEAALKFPFVKEYIKVNHSKDIPFTKKQINEALAEADFLYMRWHIGNWEEENDYYTNLKDNEWSFIANLKNYRGSEHNVAPIRLFIILAKKTPSSRNAKSVGGI